MQLEAYTDGGSRGNPGAAAIGGIIYKPGKVILHEFSKYIGTATNNEAEYTALFTALTWLTEQKATYERVVFYLDSKLVVEQMNRKWKIKEPRMRVFAQNCWDAVANLEEKHKTEVVFVHIPREENKVADLLVNQALDSL